MKFKTKLLTPAQTNTEYFKIHNHGTCFSIEHVPSNTHNIGGHAFSTREEAQAEADKWLPWFYSVSFKEPKKTDTHRSLCRRRMSMKPPERHRSLQHCGGFRVRYTESAEQTNQ